MRRGSGLNANQSPQRSCKWRSIRFRDRWNGEEMKTMKHRKLATTRLLGVGLLLTMCSSGLLGQQNSSSQPGQADPQLQLSPQKALQSFEPAADEEYTIGPGDEISLDFSGRPELDCK